MSFAIRNHGTALYEDQSEIDALDWQIVLDAVKGTGIFTGCQVSAQTTPDGSLLVSAGTYRIGGSDKTFAGGSVSVVSGSANSNGSVALAADANWARYDLIVLDFSSHLGVIHGVTDVPTFPNVISNPVFPAYDTATQCVIAAVYVTPGVTALISGLFTPKDVTISKNAFHDQVHLMSGSSHTGAITGAQHGVQSVASAHGASHITFTPAGSIAATTVQAAIEELIGEYTMPVSFSKQGTVVVTTEADTPPVFHWTNDTGRTLTFLAVRARAEVGPSGSTMTIDVNVGGTTIMTGTKVVLPNNTGAVSTVKQTTFSTTTIADGATLSMNVDTNGGGAVQNLLVTVWLKG